MNSAIIKSNSHQSNRFQQSLESGKSWFFQTAERALEQAYQAALRIKTLEEDHFGGQQVSAKTSIYTQNVLNYFVDDVKKNLRVIRLRVTEFKWSRSLGKSSNLEILEKLRFIDEILERYQKADFFQKDELTIDATFKPIKPENQPKMSSKHKLSPADFYTVEHKENINKPAGVLPRSIGRTVEKIKMGLNEDSEEELMKNFRANKKQTKTAINFLILLICLPLLMQLTSKHFIFYPLIQQYRNSHPVDIFINPEMKAEAIHELEEFEESLKFEHLLYNSPEISPTVSEEKIHHKAEEVAEEFSNKSSAAISNIFADLMGLATFALVVIFNQRGLNAFKAFLGNVIYDLSDSAKAFILILFTDIFVGFHSPHGWEVLLEGAANHFGIAANHNFIFLFIATFPVILDTIFKYWIFRYLNQISPSAVATLKNMNE
ncbi:MAG: proton extrusion protein PcxA [Lyngbya sp.]|nr:proton extrusion protein PcxA [Lyngbya sp.]